MNYKQDTTFITNQEGQTLSQRFQQLIKHTQYLDILVGYFFFSGFHLLYQSLEDAEKIRILVGIKSDGKIVDLVTQSTKLIKDKSTPAIISEMEKAEDSLEVEKGIRKFLEWLSSGKLEIKAYPQDNIHAKLYIMTFSEDDRDAGRVITGSSNFSAAGLVDNIEFNVELKARSDYEFAKKEFQNLWESALDLSTTYEETLAKKTWLRDDITPYQLYLKSLYEYFKDELKAKDELEYKRSPEEFKQLEYQAQAVINAHRILLEYGGVFLADVVGLGKTYMAARLAQILDDKILVLAPPKLIDSNNRGSWRNVFRGFHLAAEYCSTGNLDKCLQDGVEDYKYVIIDEAHKFRNDKTPTYAKLTQICRGKGIILATATPLNNYSYDILSLIKLFQHSKRSTIPNCPNLGHFFSAMQKEMDAMKNNKGSEVYLSKAREHAQQIREKILKYLMVRRTRKEISTYFVQDLKNQGLSFPEIKDPEAVFYQFNQQESEIFNSTLKTITQKIKYTRYNVLHYLKNPDLLSGYESPAQGGTNLVGFMRTLLIKRLESSFHAFRKSINRFIKYHEKFIQIIEEQGFVYISKKYSDKIFELLLSDVEDQDLENLISGERQIDKMLAEGKATRYLIGDFREDFIIDLKSDLQHLKNLAEEWEKITRDPKLLQLGKILREKEELKNKVIIFSESKETAEYLAEEIQQLFPEDKTLCFTGSSKKSVRDTVLANFDANAKNPKNDYRILVSSEVLSEGVNLHASNVVINYDIPWNPTRLMQRVGRVNRLDTKFKSIYSFNFFPTDEGNDQLKLKDAAIAKIDAFISLLGNDAQLLHEGEVIQSHELFDNLTSKATITGEDEEIQSELKYLNVIKEIRDKDEDLFKKIAALPKKARTAKKHKSSEADKHNQLITYFRKDKLHKFFVSDGRPPRELNILQAEELLQATPNTKREKIPQDDFYSKLGMNKKEFSNQTTKNHPPSLVPKGKDNTSQLLKHVKAIRNHPDGTLDENDIKYLVQVEEFLKDDLIPKNPTKEALSHIKKHRQKYQVASAKELVAIIMVHIVPDLLKKHKVEANSNNEAKQEIILSAYLVGE